MSNTPEWVPRYEESARPDHAECAKDYRALERENAAQLAELHRISEALGTNEGHSSVTHIEILKGENAALRVQLKDTIGQWLGYATDCSAAFDRQQEMLDRNAEQIAVLCNLLSEAEAERHKVVAAFAHLQSFVSGDLQEHDAAEVASMINAALKEEGK